MKSGSEQLLKDNQRYEKLKAQKIILEASNKQLEYRTLKSITSHAFC
ncbi:MAG: hypothetical protein LBU55_00545 [Elusimicrobiota bacterium]|nr:hypothetical protein [Elusimicrobiota bacterium]